MHRSLLPLLALLVASAAVAACSSASTKRAGANASADDGDGTDPNAPASNGGDPNADAGPDVAANADAAANDESCYALFHWLQKDAYKNTGGRSDPAWPPHTTTTMEVHCVDANGNDQVVGSAFRDNHGSDPGQLDPNGNPLLVEVKVSDPAYGTRDELLSLLGQYTQCECAPATQFLSMTSAQGPLESQILGGVVTYVQANLVCSGAVSTTDFVGMLQSGDFDDAVNALPNCVWTSGADWSDGLDQAASTVLAGLGSTLAGYHVCNNDAMLEAAQWNTFATTGAVVACDDTSPICSGPAWFYNP